MNQVREAITLALLAAITWGSRFYYSAGFGIYEDDQYRVPQGMGWTWAKFWHLIAQLPQDQLHMREQGRVLHPAFIHGFSFLGEQLGGLQAIYLIGYVIVLFNTWLFYALLRRLSPFYFFAVVGAIAFALFPADTTQGFLTHTLGVQPALTFLLLGFHLYISRPIALKSLSYLLALLSLFCYEKFFLVFIAAPLLRTQWHPKLKWVLVRHTLIVAAILFAVALARKASGESRVAALSDSFFLKMFTDMLLGPLVSLFAFLYRPLTALASWRIEWTIPLLLFLIAIRYLLQQAHRNDAVVAGNNRMEPAKFFKHLKQWVIVGGAMLALAYPLTWVGSVFSLSGRETRMHAAAAIGGSILCACAVSAIAFIATTHHKWRLVNWGLAIFFTLLLGFGFTIQHDFVTAWQYQRAFWTDLIELCPDMTRGTVLLFNPRLIKNPEQISARSGYLNRVISTIYQFPPEWGRYKQQEELFRKHRTVQQPVFFLLEPNWEDQIKADESGENRLRLTEETVFHPNRPKAEPIIDSTQTIVLDAKDGRLARRSQPIQINGKDFLLKPNDSKLEHPAIKPGVLYRYIINSPDTPLIEYLDNE